MTKLVLCGALGRMGRTILRLALEDSGVSVVAGVEHPDCIRTHDLGQASGIKEYGGALLTSRLEEVLPLADVVIDFTGSTMGALSHAKLCALAKKPIVIGTTGFSEEELRQIEECARETALLLSPNMSLGVNLMFKLARMAVSALKDKGFDVEILEIHHRFKKDAPSGTALALAQHVEEAWGKMLKRVYGREGISPKEDDQMDIMALRGGDVVGEHTLYLLGFGERIEITHRATSRDIFAKGAIEAGKWIKGKPAGMYSMFDVLGI